MSFEVEPAELRAHASHLDGLTDRLTAAVDAANTVLFGDSAYGVVCSFLPPLLNTTLREAAETLRASVEGMAATADDLRATALTYDEQDEANAVPFRTGMVSS
ncbi:ESX-1 secretion-associated protein [Saccharothrix sp. ALI-22-I]|uniref:type VII secretion target n=1 Tax=Saccharothrix sp. ALI-22-I TaxID=1933778 RepID=UPI00097BC789|nr:type VII secretion target [Saccharothrix sp. ALI-22-I]ONI92755.1 ESX-1 secretion-associated protein [Saccharothrix sp. ALI-22-I]